MLIVVAAILADLLFGAVALGIAARLPAFHGISLTELARRPEFLRNAYVALPVETALYLVILALMVLVVRNRGHRFVEAIRWNFPRAHWLGYVALGIALSVFVQLVSTFLPVPKNLPIDLYFRDALSAWLMALFGTLLAPFMEELFFRGFLYPLLARRLGIAVSALLTAASFALLHASQLAHAWAPVLLLFVVGLVLTLIRARTFSVAASFLVHVGYNGSLFVLLYFSTGHFHHFEHLGS